MRHQTRRKQRQKSFDNFEDDVQVLKQLQFFWKTFWGHLMLNLKPPLPRRALYIHLAVILPSREQIFINQIQWSQASWDCGARLGQWTGVVFDLQTGQTKTAVSRIHRQQFPARVKSISSWEFHGYKTWKLKSRKEEGCSLIRRGFLTTG